MLPMILRVKLWKKVFSMAIYKLANQSMRQSSRCEIQMEIDRDENNIAKFAQV
jgi:hypothetical protein